MRLSLMVEPMDCVVIFFVCTYDFTSMWDLFTNKTLVSCEFDFRIFVGWFGVPSM
jgi:hypothetical protein